MKSLSILLSQIKEKKFKTVSLFVAIVCVVISVVSVGAWRLSKANRMSITTDKTRTHNETALLPTTQTRERLSSERITVKPNGLEPTEITRTSAPFILIVDNKSGIGNLSLSLVRVQSIGTAIPTNEIPVRDIPTDNNRRKWHDQMVLPAGEYVLRAIGRPDWSCRITITQ